ncbi:MAG TPA: sugar transferase [Flavobacteriales bacterium]|nr:sugar transferase [Flavobacteriales bacterium]
MYHLIKRLFDIIASLSALVVLFPLLGPIMIGLKLTGEGHIFYFQKRIGYKNQPFDIWKFATMLLDSPNMKGGYITLRDDPRVTPMGGFLRKTKINELPQIFNVLIGTMSVVGPRPLAQVTYDTYPSEAKEKVYNRKPGITGIGSIIFRDEERMMSAATEEPLEFYKNHIAPYKAALEIWYGVNASTVIDFKIIVLTVWVIIFPKSNLQYQWLKGLPEMPQTLKEK